MTCSWWWTAMVFIGGIGVGQILLMITLMLLTGGNTDRHSDEHEKGSV